MIFTCQIFHNSQLIFSFFSARNEVGPKDYFPTNQVPQTACCDQPGKCMGIPRLFWGSHVRRSHHSSRDISTLLLLQMHQDCRARFSCLGEWRGSIEIIKSLMWPLVNLLCVFLHRINPLDLLPSNKPSIFEQKVWGYWLTCAADFGKTLFYKLKRWNIF